VTRAVPASADAACGDAAVGLTGEDLLAVVTDVLAVVCGVDAASISAQTALETVGADSLARVELAEELEERLTTYIPGLHIPDDDLGAFGTVADVRDYLAARL
jgi:acyl carrier protein